MVRSRTLTAKLLIVVNRFAVMVLDELKCVT